MTAKLDFIAPPPGFEPHTEFVLEPVAGAEGLFSLTAVGAPGMRLHLIDPRAVVADYAPTLADQHVADLGLTAADDALLLVVASRSPEGTQVNLLAPVVANTTTGRAAQVILDGQDYPLRALLG